MSEEDLDNLPPPIPEEPAPEEEKPGLIDHAQNIKDKYDQAKDVVDKVKQGREWLKNRFGSKAQAPGKEAAEQAGKQGLKGVEKQGVEQAERAAGKVAERAGSQVAGKAGSQVAGKAGQAAVQTGARVAGQAGTTAATEAATTAATTAGTTAATTAGTTAAATATGAAAGSVAPVVGTIIGAVVGLIVANAGKIVKWVKNDGWKWIVYPVGALFLLIAFVFALLAGQQLSIFPTTADQRAQATTAAAIASDPLANRQVDARVVAQEKATYASLLAAAKSKYPDKVAAAQIRVNEINALMDQLVNLQGDPKKMLLTQVLDKRAALAKDFPEIFSAAGGNCGDLAPFIYSGKFVINDSANRQQIILGKLYNGINQLKPASQDMCQALLIGLRAGYTIRTETFSHGHPVNTASGNRSLHTCGAAIDISYINGKPVNNSNADAQAISKLWYDSSQSGKVYVNELIVPSTYRQYEVKNNKPSKYPDLVQFGDGKPGHNGHETHIHLAGRIAPGACQ